MKLIVCSQNVWRHALVCVAERELGALGQVARVAVHFPRNRNNRRGDVYDLTVAFECQFRELIGVFLPIVHSRRDRNSGRDEVTVCAHIHRSGQTFAEETHVWSQIDAKEQLRELPEVRLVCGRGIAGNAVFHRHALSDNLRATVGSINHSGSHGVCWGQQAELAEILVHAVHSEIVVANYDVVGQRCPGIGRLHACRAGEADDDCNGSVQKYAPFGHRSKNFLLSHHAIREALFLGMDTRTYRYLFVQIECRKDSKNVFL